MAQKSLVYQLAYPSMNFWEKHAPRWSFQPGFVLMPFLHEYHCYVNQYPLLLKLSSGFDIPLGSSRQLRPSLCEPVHPHMFLGCLQVETFHLPSSRERSDKISIPKSSKVLNQAPIHMQKLSLLIWWELQNDGYWSKICCKLCLWLREAVEACGYMYTVKESKQNCPATAKQRDCNWISYEQVLKQPFWQ